MDSPANTRNATRGGSSRVVAKTSVAVAVARHRSGCETSAGDVHGGRRRGTPRHLRAFSVACSDRSPVVSLFASSGTASSRRLGWSGWVSGVNAMSARCRSASGRSVAGFISRSADRAGGGRVAMAATTSASSPTIAREIQRRDFTLPSRRAFRRSETPWASAVRCVDSTSASLASATPGDPALAGDAYPAHRLPRARRLTRPARLNDDASAWFGSVRTVGGYAPQPNIFCDIAEVSFVRAVNEAKSARRSSSSWRI